MDAERLLSQKIYNAALDCGFDNCGIIGPEDLLGSEKFLNDRMKKIPESLGFYAGMTRDMTIQRLSNG